MVLRFEHLVSELDQMEDKLKRIGNHLVRLKPQLERKENHLFTWSSNLCGNNSPILPVSFLKFFNNIIIGGADCEANHWGDDEF